MPLTNLDPTRFNRDDYLPMRAALETTSNQARYQKNIERAAAEYFQALQQPPILARPDTPPIERNSCDLNKQATFFIVTLLIAHAIFATAIFGPVGGMPIVIAAALSTITLVKDFCCKDMYTPLTS